MKRLPLSGSLVVIWQHITFKLIIMNSSNARFLDEAKIYGMTKPIVSEMDFCFHDVTLTFMYISYTIFRG